MLQGGVDHGRNKVVTGRRHQDDIVQRERADAGRLYRIMDCVQDGDLTVGKPKGVFVDF